MNLTKREQDVFEQIGFGKTNAQIAETLGIRIGTVKAHKKAIRVKTASRGTTQPASAFDDPYPPDNPEDTDFADPGAPPR